MSSSHEYYQDNKDDIIKLSSKTQLKEFRLSTPGILSEKDIETAKDVLEAYRKRSTCSRLKVGAIIIRDGRVVSTGWNGVAKGKLHCDKIHKPAELMTEEERLEHHKFSNEHEHHAEQNAIGFAAKYGTPTDGTVMMCSVSPCSGCAKLIKTAGIKEVYYEIVYDRSNEGLKYLEANGVRTYKI